MDRGTAPPRVDPSSTGGTLQFPPRPHRAGSTPYLTRDILPHASRPLVPARLGGNRSRTEKPVRGSGVVVSPAVDWRMVRPPLCRCRAFSLDYGDFDQSNERA